MCFYFITSYDDRTAVTAQRLIAGEETGMRSLIGKSVIALCNLKSRTFLGVESSAMLLFSTNNNNEVTFLLLFQAILDDYSSASFS